MTKKRFIKLLMAEGMPRNTAQQLARFCSLRQIPYRFVFVVAKGTCIVSGV